MVLGIADICMYEHLRAGRLNKVEFVRKAADLGAETVSIGLPTESEGQELRLVADEVGIELEFRVGGTDPEELSDAIRRAHHLGASFLRTLVSGRYDYKNAAKQKQTLESAVKGLRAVAPLLDELGLMLGVENHADVKSPELIELIDKVNSERVRVVLDLCNSVVVFEDPRYTIEILSPYTVALHVKDIEIGSRHFVDFCHLGVPLGEGIVDFDHAMQQLQANCPDARFVIESGHPPLEDLEESLREEVEMLEKSVAFAKGLLAKYCS